MNTNLELNHEKTDSSAQLLTTELLLFFPEEINLQPGPVNYLDDGKELTHVS